MKIRGHCTAAGRFRTDDSEAGATEEDVMMLVERCPTGKQLGISGGFWLLCLANPLTGQRVGDPLPLGYNFSDAAAAAATGPDGVLNIWVEPKPGAAAVPALPAVAAAAADGGGVAARRAGGVGVFHERARRSKFYTSSAGGLLQPLLAEGSIFLIDGLLFSASQTTASLHMAARTSELQVPLCAKVYTADPRGVEAGGREVHTHARVASAFGPAYPSTIVRSVVTIPGSAAGGAAAGASGGSSPLTAGSGPIIVMPYYHISVHDIIKSYLEPPSLITAATPVPARLVAMVALGSAAALDRLHQIGLAHCDIKPANIMVRLDGAPVLVDLGAATDIGMRTHEYSRVWVPPAPGPGLPTPEALVLKASAELDLRCLAATVFSMLERNVSPATISSLPLHRWADDSRPAAPFVRVCWELCSRPGATASELVRELQDLASTCEALTEADIQACLS